MLNIDLTMWPSNSAHVFAQEKWNIHLHITCTRMFVVVNKWKQLKSPSAGEQRSQIWFHYAIECCWVIKRHEAWMHATTQMNLRGIMLSERSWMQKTAYCMTSFIWMSRKSQFIETESRWVVAWGWGRGWGVTTNGDRVSFWVDGKVLKLDCGDGCATV